jgi:hypothetical protein
VYYNTGHIMIIENGVGNGSKALVDGNNQLHTFSVSETEAQSAVEQGNAYNINTGWIGLTSATESAVLYFKNDESPVNGESAVSIDAIAIGIDDEGTTTGMSTITLVRNPTAASFSTAVDMNQNRNFGSSNTLASTTLAYKGAEAATLTGGNDIAIFAMNPGNRLYAPIDFILEKGSSLGIKIDTDTSGGTTNVYAALILHRLNGKNRS